MKNSLKLGKFEISWLNGGRFELDGGAMFGVVPKKVWTRRYEADAENFISIVSWPMLVKTPDTLVLIETGLGNKMTEKQRKIFRVTEEWDLQTDLSSMGISPRDIEHVILTHGDFDHAGGVISAIGERTELTLPAASHYIQKLDWDDVLHPDKRAQGSYWDENFDLLASSDKLTLIDGDKEIVPGIRLIKTGGHHRGHQMVLLESGGEIAYHMGDLFPTTAHFNPLWVMAYDDFPLDVIALKQQWQAKAVRENAWFLFYHDPAIQYCRFDEEGNVMDA